MKLRLAKKIIKTVGTPRESAYTRGQFTRAFARTEQMQENRDARRCWNNLMEWLGPLGRADVLARMFKAPASALDLLMRTPEEEWVGYGGRKSGAEKHPTVQTDRCVF